MLQKNETNSSKPQSRPRHFWSDTVGTIFLACLLQFKRINYLLCVLYKKEFVNQAQLKKESEVMHLKNLGKHKQKMEDRTTRWLGYSRWITMDSIVG